ncbi:MAG: hypothetical protein ACYDHP_07705 [Ferrimicrobium sp.]
MTTLAVVLFASALVSVIVRPEHIAFAGADTLVTALYIPTVTEDTGFLVGMLGEGNSLALVEDRHPVGQETQTAWFWSAVERRSALVCLRVIQAKWVSTVMAKTPVSVYAPAWVDYATRVVVDPGVFAVAGEKGHLVGVLARVALLTAWWERRLC